MVLTITVVGNGQGNNGGGHAVLSPNELAQLMSGQTVTGLLNPDGSITLNSNVMSAQQVMTSLPTTMQNGSSPITSPAGQTYQGHRIQVDQASTLSNSITNMQTITGDASTTVVNNHPPFTPTTQKKTGQKRLSAKQKLAQQQQQQSQNQQQQQKVHQMQSPDTRHIMNNQSDQSLSQQPQIVATVQLPNGQIGQLIAPSGGQFWSPNPINLQQLSMAVAAATGMPQTMSLPTSSSTPSEQQQNSSQAVQQQQQAMQSSTQTQPGAQQQQPSQSMNSQQQIMTAVQMPTNNMVQGMNRHNQSQIWSGGPISISQLSALAQQGVVQLSPVQGIPSTGPNGQRVMEMIPQATIQGLLTQNGQSVQAIPLSSGGQYITQDPNDPNKWQIVPPAQVTPSQQQSQQQQQLQPNIHVSSVSNNNGTTDSQSTVSRSSSSFNQFINSSQNTVINDNAQSAQPQRKLKRLACTCPNCRDGDNNRGSGDKKKQHICHFPDCNKVYGKTSHLRAHLRWHSGKYSTEKTCLGCRTLFHSNLTH